MSKEEENVDKLIPQIFDEMRSNLDSISYRMTSAITTQSLMNELESLDKIIKVIDGINDSVIDMIPNHIGKMYDVCHSSNVLLDSWVGIQSQAGYIYRLMSDPVYINHLKEEGINRSFEDEVKLENESIDKLKREIFALKDAKDFIKPVDTVKKINRGNREISKQTRLSGIPKICKPTISSERKLFRR